MSVEKKKGFPFELTDEQLQQITADIERYFSSPENREEFYQLQLKAAREPDRLTTPNHILWELWVKPLTI